jgi:hypothetical protein
VPYKKFGILVKVSDGHPKCAWCSKIQVFWDVTLGRMINVYR